MRILFLPFLLIHLGIANTPLLVVLAQEKVLKYQALVGVSVFLVWFGITGFLHGSFFNLPSSAQSSLPLPYSSSTLSISSFLSGEFPINTMRISTYSLESLAIKNAVLLKEYPTHRDLLLNQVLLLLYLDRSSEAKPLIEKLKMLDPNHPLVQAL